MSTADIAERPQVRDLRLELAVIGGRPLVVARGFLPLPGQLGALLRLFEDHAGPRLRLAQDLLAAPGGIRGYLAAVFLRVGNVAVGRLLRPGQHVHRLDVRVFRLGDAIGTGLADHPLTQPPHLFLKVDPLGEDPGEFIGDPGAELADFPLVNAAPPQAGGREGGLPDTLRRQLVRHVHRAAHVSLQPKSSK